MGKITITKTDIVWSYIAQFLGLCTNIITLPFILTHLSSDTLAIWYVFFSISTIITLLDVGFQDAFARNVAYVYGGVSMLSKEGIIFEDYSENGSEKLDRSLLKALISTMKKFYGKATFIILLLLLIPGSLYIHYLSGDLSNYNEILLAWGVYSVSLAITFYCIMYGAILQGKGYFKEYNILKIISKLIYLILLIIGMLLGYGIIAIAFASLIAMFAYRILAPVLVNKDNMYSIIKDVIPQDVNLIRIIGYNALRAGISSIILNFTTRGSTVFFPLFVPSLALVAQYGLSMQIIGLIWGTSLIYSQVHAPLLAQYRIERNLEGLKVKFGETVALMLVIFSVGTLGTILLGNPIFSLIGSNTLLLPSLPLLFLFVVYFLDINHTLSISFIATKNYIPYLKATIITGMCVILSIFLFTKVLDWGVYGFIFAIGLCQLLYHNWKWPLEVTKELSCSYKKILQIGFCSLLTRKDNVV